MARLPTWTVFRRTPRDPDFEVVGSVSARTADDAIAAAAQLPNAPLYPVVAHARDEGALTVAPVIDLAERRSRRRAA